MTRDQQLIAPFPYFGGKRIVADQVRLQFGHIDNYVEPFFGSGAVLLAGERVKTETVNDIDGLLCNFWRAVQLAPEETAAFADWPVSETDLTARHAWLVGARESLTARLEAEPAFFDARAAGWWCWGVCAWIGSGWCSGEGPWVVQDGELRKLPHLGNRGQGINRKLPHLGNRGRGINRQLPHLGNRGQGINRKLPHLGNRGRGINEWFTQLCDRLRDVRICCGDWQRVLTPAVLDRHGVVGVFLDPPYNDGLIDYAVGGRVADDVHMWALENGPRSGLRIALCGYAEHDDLGRAGWKPFRWKARGGYSSQDGENQNATKETIWFSPHCLDGVAAMPLFAECST